jgi:hypothetical protein
MRLEAALTLSVTILLAAIGYAVKYWNDLRLAQRKDRLDRIDRQLRDLYGPLFALGAATHRLWAEFRLRHRPGVPFWDPENPPGEMDVQAWREWMTTVFMPMNRRMMDVIVDHADLLREPSVMPEPLLDLCAHVAGYEVTLARWESGEFSTSSRADNVSVVDYPRAALKDYAREAFEALKGEQARLLGAIAQRTPDAA